jgi:hypothetical protein
MQFYSKIRFRSALWALICFCMLCSCGTDKPDVSDIQVDTEIQRFDHDLSSMISKPDAITKLKDKYGLFYETFTFKILQIRQGSDEEVADALRTFVTDSSVSSVSLSIDSVYKDLGEIEQGFSEFAKHYKYYFPKDTFPRIVACNTFFNYAIAIDSGFIALGLDMFLGEKSHYYEMIGMPLFMRKRMAPQYIVPAAVLGWFNTEYPRELEGKEFLNQMIHQGKSMYYASKMLSETPDSVLLAFSPGELKWCKDNEEKIWSLFIEKKMLFSTDPSHYIKFLGEAPKSSGFPEEAPDRIGVWVGWQIVKKYMDKNTDLSLPQLIAEKDALKILEQSGYKP